MHTLEISTSSNYWYDTRATLVVCVLLALLLVLLVEEWYAYSVHTTLVATSYANSYMTWDQTTHVLRVIDYII